MAICIKQHLSNIGSSIHEKVIKKACKQPEAAGRRCSSKQLILKISQYSQENICDGVSF